MHIRLSDDMISHISNFLSITTKIQLELPLNKHDYEMGIGMTERLKHKPRIRQAILQEVGYTEDDITNSCF
jgi:hypothetical protein